MISSSSRQKSISKWVEAPWSKLSGMMLEMDNSELLILLDSDAQLKAKARSSGEELQIVVCVSRR